MDEPTSQKASVGLQEEVIIHWAHHFLVNDHAGRTISTFVLIFLVPWEEPDMMSLGNNNESELGRRPL